MDYRNTYTSIVSIAGKAFSLLVLIALLISCRKDHSTEDATGGPLAGGYSILVNNGNVLVSGYRTEGSRLSSKYWINGQSAEQVAFTAQVGNQLAYREAVDEQYRTGYTYKDRNGEIQKYRFNQIGTSAANGRMFYYKNNSAVHLESDSIGIMTSVTFYDDKPVFAGSLGKMTAGVTGSISFHPEAAFVWDGHSPLTGLSLPPKTTFFQGISTIYSAGPNEFYVGGLCGVPMYWKNTEPVVLDTRYGEVWQITKSGSDVYAVGLINKHNSNSTGHTACYWKNGMLHELEDGAQAYGIYIDGDDIYVSGAVGNVPASYRPCYWKNGVRVDLPM